MTPLDNVAEKNDLISLFFLEICGYVFSKPSRSTPSSSLGRMDETFRWASRSDCQLDLGPTERVSDKRNGQNSIRVLFGSTWSNQIFEVDSKSFRRSSYRSKISKQFANPLQMDRLHFSCWIHIGLLFHIRRRTSCRRNCNTRRKANVFFHSNEYSLFASEKKDR